MATGSEGHPHAKVPHVFMVEDNEADYLLMREAFHELGVDAELEVVTDGEEAVDQLVKRREHLPQLIILNFNLPGMQGCEALEILKRHEHLRDIPMVMLTTSDREKDRLRCCTANAYHIKAATWDDCLDLARRLIGYVHPHGTPSGRSGPIRAGPIQAGPLQDGPIQDGPDDGGSCQPR